MKRYFHTIILIIALVFTLPAMAKTPNKQAVSIAENNELGEIKNIQESDLFGNWIGISKEDDGSSLINMTVIYPDHTGKDIATHINNAKDSENFTIIQYITWSFNVKQKTFTQKVQRVIGRKNDGSEIEIPAPKMPQTAKVELIRFSKDKNDIAIHFTDQKDKETIILIKKDKNRLQELLGGNNK